MFGESIALTVIPQDQSLVKPDLSVLSPLPGQTDHQHPDVCLAAGFRPREGEMVLTVKDGLVNMTTGGGGADGSTGAVLSVQQKTFFFTGFSQNTINACELQGIVKRREEEKCEETKKPDQSLPEAETVETPSEDLHPEGARLNFYLLLLNSVRVVFTKTVAFSTMVTIRALLF